MVGALAIALLTGRLVALDSQPIAGVEVIVRWNERSVLGAVDTLRVDSTGRFGALIRDVTGDSVTFVIESTPSSRYRGARLTVPKARLTEEVRLLLVPRRWPIRRGRFTGAEVPIDPDAALRRAPDFGSFGRVSSMRVVGWMPGSYPVPVILRHDDGSRISAADSTAFWDAARDVEQSLGDRFFIPWNDTTMHGRIFPVDVRVDRSVPGAGMTFITWDSDGNIFEGSVRFHGSPEIQTRGVVEHELMHVLGFGHTTAWPSAMETRALRARTVTEEDVAYAQLLMVVHAAQQDPLVVGGMIEAGRRAETLPPRGFSSHFP
ncbi:MAG: hypothetical protein ACM3SX_15420 [Deltaproteobacteria bacterium]